MRETATHPKTIRRIAELRAEVGHELGISPPYEMSQGRITAFAEATGDRYRIHIDPPRAAQSPLGSMMARGLFTVSLGIQRMDTIVPFEGFEGKLNDGDERVRFPAPVGVDSRRRVRPQVVDLAEDSGSARVTLLQTVEHKNSATPVCSGSRVRQFATR